MPVHMPIRAVVAVVAAAVAAFAVLTFRSEQASAAGCRGASSQRISMAQAKRALFCLVNRERARRGLGLLRNSRRLQRVATVHAHDMVRFHFMSHDSPTHGGLMQRVLRSGYRGQTPSWSYGEILGAGSLSRGTPAAIFRVWMNRPIHSRAILFPTFRTMGVGGAPGMPSDDRQGRNFVITFGG